MDKLAEGMQKLGEEDLLHVITIIMDNKTSETYTKNDPEGECPSNFHQSFSTQAHSRTTVPGVRLSLSSHTLLSALPGSPTPNPSGRV